MTTALRPSEVTRLCEGTQHIKNGWTAERRAEVVVDGETVHEDSSQGEPFELWESVTAPLATGIRWTCEECDAAGTMTHSDMLSWDSAATIHQSSHANGPFGTMPKLIISEATR